MPQRLRQDPSGPGNALRNHRTGDASTAGPCCRSKSSCRVSTVCFCLKGLDCRKEGCQSAGGTSRWQLGRRVKLRQLWQQGQAKKAVAEASGGKAGSSEEGGREWGGEGGPVVQSMAEGLAGTSADWGLIAHLGERELAGAFSDTGVIPHGLRHDRRGSETLSGIAVVNMEGIACFCLGRLDCGYCMLLSRET